MRDSFQRAGTDAGTALDTQLGRARHVRDDGVAGFEHALEVGRALGLHGLARNGFLATMIFTLVGWQ